MLLYDLFFWFTPSMSFLCILFICLYVFLLVHAMHTLFKWTFVECYWLFVLFICALIFPTKIHIKIYKRFFSAIFFFSHFSILFFAVVCVRFLSYLFKLFFHTVFCFSWKSLTIPLKLNRNCSEKLCTSVIYYVDFKNCINWWKNIAWNVFVWFFSFVFFFLLYGNFSKKQKQKTPTDAICSCCSWLFDWIKMEFSVCSAHPLICVCVCVPLNHFAFERNDYNSYHAKNKISVLWLTDL